MAVVKLLLDSGANPNPNAHPTTEFSPLTEAAISADPAIVELLLSKGADVKVVNRFGQTTADMANGPVQRIQPFPEALALLESLGAKNNHKCISC